MPSRLLRALWWRAHRTARNLAWLHGHRIRRWRMPQRRSGKPRTVLHVTTSFDLGGTQKQIEHLATASATQFDHRVIEIFPELNYLYRREVSVDPQRYIQGGVFGRAMGRAVVNRSRRGWQLVQVWKLLRDFADERPDVVVGWGHEICATMFVAAAVARVPHIVFCIRTVNPDHGWADVQLSSLLLRAHRRMTPLVDRVVVNSTFLQQDHAAWLSIEPSRIAVCPNGVAIDALGPADADEARQRVRRQWGIAGDAVVISNVGRFSSEKGQMSLVEANRRLQKQVRRPIVWLLCGDGPTLSQVQAAAAAESMTNMIFAGRTTAVSEILAASDIFVMPSEFEGMPNAMLEAMAAGLPCVSTTLTGARDVARDQVEALYYPPGNIQLLVEHLAALIDDVERARQIGTSAKARVHAFDVRRFVRCFEAVIGGLSPSRTSVALN